VPQRVDHPGHQGKHGSARSHQASTPCGPGQRPALDLSLPFWVLIVVGIAVLGVIVILCIILPRNKETTPLVEPRLVDT